MAYCVDGPCPDDTPTNADRIRGKMADDIELAKLCLRYEGQHRETINESGGGKHTFYGPDGKEMKHDDALQAWLDWLQQPAKEEV
jgi:hypothetical protein